MNDWGRAALPIVLAGLLVLAGCTAPGGTTTPPGDADPAADSLDPAAVHYNVRDVAEHWGFNGTLTFHRVQGLLGVDGDLPKVHVSTDRMAEGMDGLRATERHPLYTIFGFNRSTGNTTRDNLALGLTTDPWTITLNPNLSRSHAETTLAHEYMHAIAMQDSWQLDGLRPGEDYRLLQKALIEGCAVYVDSAYESQFVTDKSLPAAIDEYYTPLAANFSNMTGGQQYLMARYYYGVPYVRSHVENASEMPELFADGPRTTEQLLHAQTPQQEPPMNQSVSIPSDASNEGDAQYVRLGTMGEMFTRLTLMQELDHGRAVAAAGGWGNDSMTAVENDGTTEYAWVTRWDTPEDAEEFQAAIEDFGRARPKSITWQGDTYPARFATERATEETVVVYIGTESLPKRIGVTVTDGDATLDAAS